MNSMHVIVCLLDKKKSYKCSFSGSILGLLLIYINDLHKITYDDAKVTIFTDDTSIIVINYNQGGLKTALNNTIYDIMSWFKVNFLLLTFSKRYYLEFRTETCIDTTLDIQYFNKSIANFPYTKFLCLLIDDTLNLG